MLVLNPPTLPGHADPNQFASVMGTPMQFQNVFPEILPRTNEFVVGFRKLTWEALAELVQIAICSANDPMTIRFQESVQCSHPAPLYQARLSGSLIVDSPLRRESINETHALSSLINTLLRLGAIKSANYQYATVPLEHARYITQIERSTVPLQNEDGLCSVYLTVVEGCKWEFLARIVISRIVRECGCVVSIREVEPALRGRVYRCQ